MVHCCTPIADALTRTGARPCLTGLDGSTPGFALTQLMHPQSGQLGSRPWLIVTKSDEAAARLYDDLRFYHDLSGLPETSLALFPRWETLPYEATAPHVGLIARRMNALHQIRTLPAAKVVTSVDALMQRLMPVDTFVRTMLTFKVGAAIEREALTAGLLRLGYRRVSVVEIPGEFSIRGGIVDIFSTAYTEPLRVEFLGETVESVRFFDPATQKSTDRIHEGSILPAREFVQRESSSDALRPLTPDA